MSIHPKWFYNLDGPEARVTMNCYEGRNRWVDEHAEGYTDEDDTPTVLTKDYLLTQYRRKERDYLYSCWLQMFGLKTSVMRWQVVQVMTYDHEDKATEDWWGEYRDCLFRVFVNPYTHYEDRKPRQYYVLCPEDAFLVNAYECRKKGIEVPRRSTWRYLPDDKELRAARIIPVACCRHYRHETTRGEAPSCL